jgi:hypothetical protein
MTFGQKWHRYFASRKMSLIKRSMIYNYLQKGLACVFAFLCTQFDVHAQVDTTFIYKTGTPFGTLDLRIAKSSSRYYYLKEDETFSYRENSAGVRTSTYRDMTSWDSSPYRQGNLREKNGSNDYFILNYRLMFPVGYRSDYSPGYPLIVMMHGAGERGNCWNNDCYHDDRSWNPNSNSPPAPQISDSELLNNDHNLLHGGKPHLDARNLAGSKLPDDPTLSSKAFPGFVLFPQNLNGWASGTVQDAIRLIRLLVKKYRIDPDRIYIHGLSNGGIAVYESIKRAPWLFAAALPMSSPSDANIISSDLTSSTAHIPIWTFQGGLDSAPTPSRTEGYVKKFRDSGAIVKYTRYDNLGHGVWNAAYKEPDFFSWMLSQNKANIHVFAGNPAICLTNGQGVRMELAQGFRAYQWSRNGIVIEGASTAAYVANSTGTYRARFSRKQNPGSSDWNEWSDPVSVTESIPTTPEIEQIGTVMLKDLNYYNYGRLMAKQTAARYYWYKDNELINLSGSQDDTTRYPRFSAGDCSAGNCAGNGSYHLITSTPDGCKSSPSEPINIYFSNQAPVSITSPSNFAGQPVGNSSVKLSWTDRSTNETGFEIWRRTALGSDSYSKWEMRTITTTNATTYYDNGVSPSATYHYKIRAVSKTARSNYTPSASNAYLVINTTGDDIDPSIPQSLAVSTVGIGAIKLTWVASTDNTGIKQYRIYYNGNTITTGSISTTYTIEDLPINEEFEITVKAEDLGGNLSSPSSSVSVSTYVSGLYYEHSTGAWQSIDQINWLTTPEYTGHVPNITLSRKTQADYFNFRFEGYLYIRGAGIYQFRTMSSDGSRVELDDVVVVNNDGLHDTKRITGPNQSLSIGAKRIVVKFFEYDGSETLTVQYNGPDTNYGWIRIPDAALNSGSPETFAAATAPATVNPDMPSPQFIADVYPNPTNAGDINVKVETLQKDPVNVRLLDFTGNEVFQADFDASEVSNGIRIMTKEMLEEGMYILLMQQNNEFVQKRLSIRN